MIDLTKVLKLCDEAQALADAATKEPWTVANDYNEWGQLTPSTRLVPEISTYSLEAIDAAFIARSRTIVPESVLMMREMAAELALARGQVEAGREILRDIKQGEWIPAEYKKFLSYEPMMKRIDAALAEEVGE